MKKKLQRVIQWRISKGELPPITYQLGQKETQVYAAFTFPRDFEQISHSSPIEKELTKIPIDEDIIEPIEMNKSYAFHLIKEKIISFETDIPPVSLRTYYLPVYLYSWELPRDEIFYKYLNGFNRRYYGDTEYSFIKLFGIQSGFLFLTPLTLALQIREIPVFLTFSSASLSVFALGMIAWISRIISFRTPLHTKRKEKLKISEEIAQNTQYQEQDQIDTEMEFLKSRKKEDKEEEVKEKKNILP